VAFQAVHDGAGLPDERGAGGAGLGGTGGAGAVDVGDLGWAGAGRDEPSVSSTFTTQPARSVQCSQGADSPRTAARNGRPSVGSGNAEKLRPPSRLTYVAAGSVHTATASASSTSSWMVVTPAGAGIVRGAQVRPPSTLANR